MKEHVLVLLVLPACLLYCSRCFRYLSIPGYHFRYFLCFTFLYVAFWLPLSFYKYHKCSIDLFVFVAYLKLAGEVTDVASSVSSNRYECHTFHFPSHSSSCRLMSSHSAWIPVPLAFSFRSRVQCSVLLSIMANRLHGLRDNEGDGRRSRKPLLEVNVFSCVYSLCTDMW